VLSLPNPQSPLLTAQSHLVKPVLQVVHRMMTRQLPKQAGAKPERASPPGL
jgi:hypothetical protein